jgi:hypothetical protein
MEKRSKNSIEELNSLEQEAWENKYTENEIFSEIGRLDKKYKEDINYKTNVNGTICNIGSMLGYINVLNYGAKRLKDLLKDNEYEKYIYDLGNTLLCVAEIEVPYPRNIESLISYKKFNEARKYFSRIKKIDHHYPQATTNSANILEKYGRNFESIYLYDEALENNPTFGMALANKAQAIEYYISLTPSVSLRLVDLARILYKKALSDESLFEIGGPNIFENIRRREKILLDFLESSKYSERGSDTQPENLNEYQKFCLRKNLFLNYDFGYYYDSSSLHDNLFPSFIESLKEPPNRRTGVMSERVYFAFQVFNQILESYTSSRLQYFMALSSDNTSLDSLVTYTYTFDYTKHSHRYGALKNTLASLYNCLDKIAHLMHYYFVGYHKKNLKNLYFNWFLFDSYKDIVLEQDSFQLLALHNLALDFEQGNIYHSLKLIRNRITHSFLNINTEVLGFNEEFDYEITESMLIKENERLFLIVKAAILYAIAGLSHQKIEGDVVSIDATLERQIFK